MPHDDFNFICPYYYKTIGNALFCEAFSAGTNIPVNESYIKQCFETRAERNLCIKKYCASFKYPQCRIAAVNELMEDFLYGKK